MNIVLGTENVAEVKDKYVVLELDSFLLNGSSEPVSAYAIIENVPIEELSTAEQFRDLHHNMIKNYRQQNWIFCRNAIEHLMGMWHNEVDSFYEQILSRIDELEKNPPEPSWTGVIDKRTDLQAA